MENKEKNPATKFILGLAFVLILSYSIFVSRSVSEIDSMEDDLKKYYVLIEAINHIQRDYVDPEAASTELLIKNAIKGMMSGLDDYSSYFEKQDYEEFDTQNRGSFGGLGIHIQVIDKWLTVVSPMPDTPAFRMGILKGDKIIKINGESTRGIDVLEAVDKLRGPKGTEVTITILRKNENTPQDYTIVRDIIEIKNVESSIVADDIGYIRIKSFTKNIKQEILDALDSFDKETEIKGIVLDMRFNTGGLLETAVEVSDLFLDKGKTIVSIRERNPEDVKEYKSEEKAVITLPVVVLVNQITASACEIVTGALQDWKRAIVVGPEGKNTYGKGLVQTVIQLQDGSGMKFTTAHYYTPSGRSINKLGITPDISVPFTEENQRKLMISGNIGILPPNKKNISGYEEISMEEKHLLDYNEAVEEEKLFNGDQKPEKLDVIPSVSEEKDIPSHEEVFEQPKDKPKQKKKEDIMYDIELKTAVDILKSIDMFRNGMKLK